MIKKFLLALSLSPILVTPSNSQAMKEPICSEFNESVSALKEGGFSPLFAGKVGPTRVIFWRNPENKKTISTYIVENDGKIGLCINVLFTDVREYGGV